MQLRRIVTSLTAVACLSASGVGIANGASRGDANYRPLPTAVTRDLAVPVAALNAVGAGDGNQAPTLVSEDRIRENGKPEVAYVVGEFCAYCAGESWSLVVALERFGTFSGLSTLTSSAADIPKNIRSISLRYAHYTSRYLTFDAVVNEDANLKPVEPVPANVKPAWAKAHHGYPFIDFGGRAVLKYSSFSASVLEGMSRVQIASELAQAARPVSQAIVGTANQLTAAICLATGNQPGKVCGSKTIATIEGSLRR